MRTRTAALVGLVLVGGATLGAQLAREADQTLRIQWEIDGPVAPAGGARPPFEVATAQGYLYKIFQVGGAVGEALLGVQCTTTADPFVKTCAATVPPAFSAPGLSVDMTATIDGIETAHSTAAIVPPLFVPPVPPRNLRMLRYVGQVPVPTNPTGRTGVNPATPGAGAGAGATSKPAK